MLGWVENVVNGGVVSNDDWDLSRTCDVDVGSSSIVCVPTLLKVSFSSHIEEKGIERLCGMG